MCFSKNLPQLFGRSFAEYIIDVKGDDFVATISSIRGFERFVSFLSSSTRWELDECFSDISWLMSSRYR